MSQSAETASEVQASGQDAMGSDSLRKKLIRRLAEVRSATESLVETLAPEDQNLQSMPEASPAKWHRAHTTWFFETFVLEADAHGYKCFSPAFAELFNSYYNGVGRQHPRAQRSLLSRPASDEIGRYRRYADEALQQLLWDCGARVFERIAPLIELGINHEQQHQELMLTDLKHAFSFNPLAPRMGHGCDISGAAPSAMEFIAFDGGMVEIGSGGAGFCFDNEAPRHRVWLPNPFELADRPVNCGEFLEFIEDGGYREPLLWLSDGWTWVEENKIDSPLYWSHTEAGWQVLTLGGPRAIDPGETVCHLNFYEAQAFAEWSGARLPSEAEWESVAADRSCRGNFADSGRFHPAAPQRNAETAPAALFGDVWEWTQSAYAPYPGFKPAAGAIGEYNGKFMANQMVLRGGSCATPPGHVRATYRNFFYPPDRWQFSGVRLARDMQ